MNFKTVILLFIGISTLAPLGCNDKDDKYSLLAKSIDESDAPGEAVFRQIVADYNGVRDIEMNSTKIHDALLKNVNDARLLKIVFKGVGIYSVDKNTMPINSLRVVATHENTRILKGVNMRDKENSVIIAEKDVVICSNQNEKSEVRFTWIISPQPKQ